MPSSDVRVRLGLDNKPLKKGLKQSENAVVRFAKGAKTQLLGILGVGAFSGMVRESIALGSELSDLALRTGTTVEEFQALRDAARDAGVEQSVLERALRNLNIRTQQAVDGNKSYSDALARLGINAKEFAKLNSGQKFELIAKQIQNASNQSEAFADSARILGERAGPQLVEVLKRTADEGLSPMIKKLDEAGALMNNETAQALDSAEDKIQRLQDRMIIWIGKGIIPVVNAWKVFQTTMISGSTKIVGEVLKMVSSVSSGLGQLTGFFGDNKVSESMRKFATEMKIYSEASLEVAKEKAIDAEKALDDFKNGVDTIGGSSKKASTDFDAMASALGTVEKQSNNTKKSLKSLNAETKRTLEDIEKQSTPSGKMKGLSREERRQRREERNKVLREKKLAREYRELEEKQKLFKRLGMSGFSGESMTNLGTAGTPFDMAIGGIGSQKADIARKLGLSPEKEDSLANTIGDTLIKKQELSEEKKKGFGGTTKTDSEYLAEIAKYTEETSTAIQDLT